MLHLASLVSMKLVLMFYKVNFRFIITDVGIFFGIVIKISYLLILNLHVEVNEAVCSDSVGMHQPKIPDKEEELQELWHGDSQPL